MSLAFLAKLKELERRVAELEAKERARDVLPALVKRPPGRPPKAQDAGH